MKKKNSSKKIVYNSSALYVLSATIGLAGFSIISAPLFFGLGMAGVAFWKLDIFFLLFFLISIYVPMVILDYVFKIFNRKLENPSKKRTILLSILFIVAVGFISYKIAILAQR